MSKITTLFLDIGGVILTNGFDRHIRQKLLNHFKLENEPFNELHKKYYDLHEQGLISLTEYLEHTIFWKTRNFKLKEVLNFIQEESKPNLEMLSLIQNLKIKYDLKITTVSNEGRDLAEYRIKKFNLIQLIDIFVISSFVGYQKPDPRIYQMALDITQRPLEEILYIDDRDYLVYDAQKLGIKGIVHQSLDTTKKELDLILSH